ncbi:hypothetical protein [Spirosoma horti]
MTMLAEMATVEAGVRVISMPGLIPDGGQSMIWDEVTGLAGG